MEKSVPLPLLPVVPTEPINEPLEVSEVVFSLLPSVVVVVPMNFGELSSVYVLVPLKSQ